MAILSDSSGFKKDFKELVEKSEYKSIKIHRSLYSVIEKLHATDFSEIDELLTDLKQETVFLNLICSEIISEYYSFR